MKLLPRFREICTDACETSRSVAMTLPFVLTTMSWSPPRNGPFRSNGTGLDQVRPRVYECHSSGPFGSPIAATYTSPNPLVPGNVLTAIDGSAPRRRSLMARANRGGPDDGITAPDNRAVAWPEVVWTAIRTVRVNPAAAAAVHRVVRDRVRSRGRSLLGVARVLCP